MSRSDDFPRKMFHPDLPPFRNRVIGYIICVPLSFVIAKFYYELPVTLCIIISIAFAIGLSLAVFFEVKSVHKDKEFINSVNSGEFHSDEKWSKKYTDYVRKHDFEHIKANSMKTDLDRRFLKPSGIIWLTFALVFFIAAAVVRTGLLETNVILAVSGLLFAVWGAVKLMKTPVRPFIKRCGEKLPEIERSYLSGRMLCYRKNGEHSCNNGLNIGGNYIVLYDSKNINYIDRNEIESVSKHVTKTKYYGNAVYNGSLFTYSLIIDLREQSDSKAVRRYKLDMNEFQVEMAYEALSVNSCATSGSIAEHVEAGY